MKDKLSALIDGDLDENTMRPVFDRLRRDDLLRKDWEAYCLIGDHIRGDGAGPLDFVDRVMAGLEAEPTVLAPAASTATAARRAALQALMPIAASVMGVAAVGLVAATLYSQDAAVAPASVAVQRISAQPLLAASAQMRDLTGGTRVQADDPMREYVFAHQGVSGGPMPAAVQYVRTVSAQSAGTGR